jgi:prolyl oligopeptidase
MKTPLGNKLAQRARRLAWVVLGLAVALCGTAPAGAQPAPESCPPATRTDRVVDVLHGVRIPDPYRWLENQTSPETRAWIAAQDRCTFAAVDTLPGRQALRRQLMGLMNVDLTDTPVVRGDRYFYMKRPAGEDLKLLYLRQGPNGRERVLLDPRPLSTDHSTSITLLDVSNDGRLVAYGIRKGGEDELTVRMLDAATGKALPDTLPRARYFIFGPGSSFGPEGKGFYYARMTPAGPRAFEHRLGTPEKDDRELFGRGYGTDKILTVQVSAGGRYLLFTALYGAETERSDLYVQERGGGPARPIFSGVNAFFTGFIAGGTLYALTNWQAPNWRILAASLDHPDEGRTIVREGRYPIEDFNPAGGRLLVRYVRGAADRLVLFSRDGKREGEIPLPASGTVDDVHSDWKTRELFFTFQSLVTPKTVYRYAAANGPLAVWARPNLPFDARAFVLRQVWYRSKDGTRVPMFLFYKKGFARNGRNAALLTGYGGFDVSDTPEWREEAAVWVERGGIWALANLRGGGEFGEAWHRAGMLGKKQNVFDDFLAAAEWLVRNRYTSPRHLAIQGASNGGLLVGAALVQRPDLFQAVVCMYPLLDMLRYQKFLVAQWWVPEYGSADDAKQFNYLYAYSPYEQVRDHTAYPAVLFVTGDGDTRVAPLHARKMAARLQAATSSRRPILLLYDTRSGHSGGRPLGREVEELTNILSFLFWQTGARPAGLTK